jgi:hypothetical protein
MDRSRPVAHESEGEGAETYPDRPATPHPDLKVRSLPQGYGMHTFLNFREKYFTNKDLYHS